MGYFKAPDWLIDDVMKLLTNSELRVLLFLIRVSNDKGSSFYGITKISEIVGIGRTQTKLGLRYLENKGYIKRKFRKGSSTTYVIHERFREDTQSENRPTPVGGATTPWSEFRPYKEYTVKETKTRNLPAYAEIIDEALGFLVEN